MEGLYFRTDAQLEYIQRLTELEPEFSQSEVRIPPLLKTEWSILSV